MVLHGASDRLATSFGQVFKYCAFSCIYLFSKPDLDYGELLPYLSVLIKKSVFVYYSLQMYTAAATGKKLKITADPQKDLLITLINCSSGLFLREISVTCVT